MQISSTALELILSGLGSILLIFLTSLLGEAKKLRVGVESLNLKIAVIIEKIDSHERRIGNLENKGDEHGRSNRVGPS